MDSASNLILCSLPDDERAAFESIFQPTEMRQHAILFDVREAATHVWFPLSGAVSLVVPLGTGEAVETALVGRDGVIGVSAALDGRASLNRAVVQISGRALQCHVQPFRHFVKHHPVASALLSRHEHVQFAHAQQTAACNLSHQLPNRLARWLLRAKDLCGSDNMPITQEDIAAILGVRRTSISLVAQLLQQAGLINYSRGRITIRDAAGLEGAACECYKTVRMHYESLGQVATADAGRRLA